MPSIARSGGNWGSKGKRQIEWMKLIVNIVLTVNCSKTSKFGGFREIEDDLLLGLPHQS